MVLKNLGASGPLELLSPLTALKRVLLTNNSFAGEHHSIHDLYRSPCPLWLGQLPGMQGVRTDCLSGADRYNTGVSLQKLAQPHCTFLS